MKLKLNIKDIVLIIIVLVLVVVNLALLTKVISLKSEPKDAISDKTNVTSENKQNKSEEEQELEKLKKMTERVLHIICYIQNLGKPTSNQ